MNAASTPVVLRKRYRLPAPPERVWAALTTPREMQLWLSEHAQVDPRVGGDYRFWGRHTAWCTTPDNADQRLTAFEPGRALAFTWTWRGVSNEVSMTLSREGDGVSLHLAHTADPAVWDNECEATALLGDLWDGAIGNLRSYLATGRALLRPDYATPARDVRLSIEIDAPAERVFAALTDPEQMNRWLSTAAEVDLRPGGVYRYGWTVPSGGASDFAGPAQLLEVVPNRKLKHDWSYHNEGPSNVTWELEPLSDSRTRVTITHVFEKPHDDLRPAYTQGWTKFLVALKYDRENTHFADRE